MWRNLQIWSNKILNINTNIQAKFPVKIFGINILLKFAAQDQNWGCKDGTISS